MSMKNYLDKIGFAGSVFTSLCCLGFPALAAILSSVGAAFLMNDAILLPLLILFLSIGAWGLFSSYRTHRRPHALVLHALSSMALVVFMFVFYVRPLAFLAIGGLLGSTVWNLYLKKACCVIEPGEGIAKS